MEKALQVQVQCCFTSTETIRTVRDWKPRTATSTFTQLLNSVGKLLLLLQMLLYVHRDHKDGEPMTAISAFTQLLSSVVKLLLLL